MRRRNGAGPVLPLDALWKGGELFDHVEGRFTNYRRGRRAPEVHEHTFPRGGDVCACGMTRNEVALEQLDAEARR